MSRTDPQTSNLYTILRVEPGADAPTIKKAFHKLSLTHHPDKAGNSAAAHQRYVAIVEAYEALSDAAQRRTHDDNDNAAEDAQPWSRPLRPFAEFGGYRAFAAEFLRQRTQPRRAAASGPELPVDLLRACLARQMDEIADDVEALHREIDRALRRVAAGVEPECMSASCWRRYREAIDRAWERVDGLAREGGDLRFSLERTADSAESPAYLYFGLGCSVDRLAAGIERAWQAVEEVKYYSREMLDAAPEMMAPLVGKVCATVNSWRR
ncbi:hypothetical protein DL766_006257 [Monosporascus sp. MC13-8B]|uniref:J domain-containing protein n=1 Tax=Monosporascus cannonballus TaxID=155416 RepID=A0ABY0GTD2_9PEZI|nr:hypothetical protein DL762_009444 [Monosporascus cannonballus]RYO84756.1 hypothetical protein DL763_007373 [Monosporascus cannonballus]RYP27708.1 hypothetical protein DL766_006257 [Monosporascus sp. MC13-8B]